MKTFVLFLRFESFLILKEDLKGNGTIIILHKTQTNKFLYWHAMIYLKKKSFIALQLGGGGGMKKAEKKKKLLSILSILFKNKMSKMSNLNYSFLVIFFVRIFERKFDYIVLYILYLTLLLFCLFWTTKRGTRKNKKEKSCA